MSDANTLRLSGLSSVDPSSLPTSRERSTDPLDVFGAITRLIEQGLSPEDLENFPESNQEVLESSLGAGAFEPVENERNPSSDGDSSTLKSNLDELERAIEQHGRQLELTRSQSAEASLAAETAEAIVAQLREEVRAYEEKSNQDENALREGQQQLVQIREEFESFKRETNAAFTKEEAAHKWSLKEFREFRLKTAREATSLLKSERALLGERSRVASLKREIGAIREEQEEMRRAKEAVAAELANTREVLEITKGALSLERERVANLQGENEATCHEVEALRSEKESAEADLARLYVDIHVSQDNANEAVGLLQGVKNDLADECRRAVALEQEIHAVREEKDLLLEDLGKAREECREARVESEEKIEDLRKACEALAAERERSASSKQEAEAACKKEEDMQATVTRMVRELERSRDEFEESKRVLAAERERSQVIIQKTDAIEKEAVEARAAMERAEAAETKVKGELSVLREESISIRESKRRVEKSLVAERKRFMEYREATEAKMKLLQEEANRVRELEDELHFKNLRLKQKEAEARALKTDGKVVMELRESLSCKDMALDELRKELGNLRKASSVAATKQQLNHPQHRREHSALTNTAIVATHASARSSPAQSMSRKFSSWSDLHAIMEKESSDEPEGNGKPKAEKCQGSIPLLSPCNSEKMLEVFDDSEGNKDEDESNELSKSTPQLKLDPVCFEKDDDSEMDNGDGLAGKSPAPERAFFPEWTRESGVAGGNAAAASANSRGAKVSLSLSPASRGGAMARSSHVPASKSLSPMPRRAAGASWCPDGRSSQLKMPATNLLPTPQRKSPLAHGLGEDGNIVCLELGAWRVRAGVIVKEVGRNSKSFFDDFPCCLARPIREGANLEEMLLGASSFAAPMFEKFRETGVFVGGDAWYCCHDHPSITLRSKLELSCPTQGGTKLGRDDANMLMEHAFSLLKQDASSSWVLLTYKPTATSEEVVEMASVLLEAHQVPSIRLINEAELAALAVGVTTGVLVDIGESGFSVTPMFEGCPVAPGARWEAVGGAAVTAFMDTMLHSRSNEEFNKMTDKRRLELSRQLKEELCYVALDFNVEVEEHGSFCQRVMRVYNGAQISPRLSNYEAHDTDTFFEDTEKDEGITASRRFTLKSGEDMFLIVGRERFHAPEILFTPSVWSDAAGERGLGAVVMDAVAQVHSDTRAEMLRDVVVIGGSASIEGLGQRLEKELKAMLPRQMADRVGVRVPPPAGFRHRNPISRGCPSAVSIGAEILLDREGSMESPWISSNDWAEHPGVVTAALAPFVRG